MHQRPLTFTNANMHCTLLLIDFIEGRWEPPASELEQMLDHLVMCIDCQTVLAICREIQKDEENQLNNTFRSEVDMLISSLEESVHDGLLQNSISVYIDTIELQGEDVASERFPTLTRHIATCKACQTNIEETRTLLHETEEAEFTLLLYTSIQS